MVRGLRWAAAWGLAALAGAAWAENAVIRELKTSDVEAMVKVGRLVLSGQVKSINDIPDGIVTPVLIKKYGEQVSIAVFRDRAPLTRYSFHGKNLLDDMYGMMLRATVMSSHRFYGFDEPEKVGFFVEMVASRESIKPADWKRRLSLLALGVEGVEVTDEREVPVEGGEKAPAKGAKGKRKITDMLMPSAAVIDELDSRDAFVFRLCERMKLYPSRRPVMPSGSLLWDEKKTKVNLFGTRSFLVLPGEEKAQELFRVNTRPEAPGAGELVGMARAAADYTCERQGPDGTFCLSYRPSTGELPKSYDMVTHGLAVEALLDLYERTKEARYLGAATRGLEYALGLTRVETKGGSTRRFVVSEERVDLGYTALTAANLARLHGAAPGTKAGKNDTEQVLREMAQFLVDMQYDDGSFRYSYQYDLKVPFQYESRPAHPDMAAWALVCLAGQRQGGTMLEHATLATTFLVTKREASMNWEQAPAFTWLARTLRKLYGQNHDQRYADYLFRMADTVVAEQYSAKSNRGPDVTGAYAANVQQLVTATACKMVVVNEAALLARELKDKRAEGYVNSVKLASGFLAANRFRPENSFYLADPGEVRGEFRAGIYRTTVTVDTDAFAIQALLGLDELLKDALK